jgi:hypothetical protein
MGKLGYGSFVIGFVVALLLGYFMKSRNKVSS